MWYSLDKYDQIINSKKHGKPRGTNGNKTSTYLRCLARINYNFKVTFNQIFLPLV